MNEDWLAFLKQAGARIVDGTVEGFGDAHAEAEAAANGTVLADLSHFGLILAQGADTASYLQNQVSNDVREVSRTHSQLTAHCSPKGRILTGFRLFQRGDDYILRMPMETLAPTLARLRKYILMSKVTLEDISDKLIRFGVSGPDVTKDLEGALGAIPANVDEVTESAGTTIIRVASAPARYEIYGEVEPMKALWEQLSATATPVGAGAWGLLDIHSGIPSIHSATVEAFVPQMVNLHLLNGVSFRKGCYPGQEVVARMQYLGKLKRRMYLAHVDSPERPQPGDELCAPGEESGQGTGKIVEAQLAPGGGYDLLAVLQIGAAEAGEVHLGSDEGPRLTLKPLPYSFEDQA